MPHRCAIVFWSCLLVVWHYVISDFDGILLRNSTVVSLVGGVALYDACMQERKRYPQLIEIAARVPPNSELTKEEFQDHLAELDKSLRSVPATAQVHHSTLALCQLHTR